MPSPTRGRVRRAVMGLGASGVLAAGLQVTTAVPAHADCYYSGPGDYDYTCDIERRRGGPGRRDRWRPRWRRGAGRGGRP
jgi:hypothetical protein